MAVGDSPESVLERTGSGLRAATRSREESTDIGPSPTPIEMLLKTRLPDWQALLAAAGGARQDAPMTTVAWAQTNTLRSNRGLRKGDDCDIWAVNGGLCLYRHPGLLERLLGWLYGLVARLFAPLLDLRARFDSFLVQLAARFGPIFAIIGIPLALIGFVADAIALLTALLRALPALVLSPLTLLKEIVAIPFRLAMALLSRVLRTFLLAWLGPWLQNSSTIETLLRRHTWLRGVIVGFLRSDRPAYPVLIPTSNLSQVYQATRLGLTGKKNYLVIVEGDPMVAGMGGWLRLSVKELILPFYWERTVHMLYLPKAESGDTLRAISRAIGRPIT